VLIAAAQAGCRVTGLDKFNQLLARCRAKLEALPSGTRDRITLVEADMTDFQLSRTFKLAIVPFRPIHHLTTVNEQLSFLRCQHLEPGPLVFDAFKPNLALLAAAVNLDETEDTPELNLPDGRRLRRAFRVLQKRHAEQCNDCELIYYLDGRPIVHSFAMRYFFRFELEHLLARSGFEVTVLYGGFDRSAFVDNSPEMIFAART